MEIYPSISDIMDSFCKKQIYTYMKEDQLQTELLLLI